MTCLRRAALGLVLLMLSGGALVPVARAETPVVDVPGSVDAGVAPHATSATPSGVSRPRDAVRLAPPTGPLRWLSDGLLLLAGALVFLGLLLRRQLADMPPWMRPALVGVVAGGFVLRWLLSPVNQMEAWAWTRVNPLAAAIFDGPALAAWMRLTGGSVALVDVVSDATFVVATLTPLILFAHARYVLKDDRAALAAAFVVAVLPEHLRFSRSDAAHIQAIATSSFTFLVLYGALTDVSKRWRVACLVLLPIASWITYRVRPENIAYVGLDLAGMYVVARRGVPWKRLIAPAVLVLSAAGVAFVTHLRSKYGQNVDEGLSFRTLQQAWMLAKDVGARNTLLNLHITPPLLVLGALVGGYALVRKGDAPRAAFLWGWLGVFFVVNAYVYAPTPEMQARYHLNLVTPFVFLAAAAVPFVLRFRPAVAWGLGGVVALSPVLHRGFVTDTQFAEMQEFELVNRVRHVLPADCALVEYTPVSATGFHEPSRWARVASEASAGPVSRWPVVRWAGGGRPARVTAPCEVFLVGLTCSTLVPEGSENSCESFTAGRPYTVLDQLTSPPRFYDNVSLGLLPPAPDEGRLDEVRAAVPKLEYSVRLFDPRTSPTTPGTSAAAPESP